MQGSDDKASHIPTQGALAGVKVVDLTDERGIYGAKLLADLGAEVVRVVPVQGDPLARRGPLHNDDSLYYAFFASNRRQLPLDTGDAQAVQQFNALLQRADIVMTCAGHFALDCATVAQPAHPAQVWIDTTSFGDDGPWADYLAPDLVAGALGGAVATTGDADTPPLKAFGELNFMVSGVYGAIAALSGLYARRQTGQGQRAAVSVHESIASCLEQVLMFYWYHAVMQRDDPVLPRRGPTHWSDAFTVFNGANGSIMVTPTPAFDKQLAWLIEEDAHGDLIDPKYGEPENLRLLIERTMQLLAEWVAPKDVEALFFEAQARHMPYGWVQPLARVADNPQLRDRDWFVPYLLPHGQVKGPGAPYRFSATPWQMDQSTTVNTESVLTDLGWAEQSAAAAAGADNGHTDTDDRRPLAGLKVLDFSHVLAGPFATRVLADMGADVVKVNSESRALSTNVPSHPYYIMWNRNKRALALDMSNPAARPVCRQLCEQADVVIDNFSVGVLDRWGVGYASVRQANPGVIYVQMSGMGEGGCWSDFVTYAPTIHALSGLTSLTGVPGREDIGLGFSYNDHQAGLHGAVAILAALEARQRTGAGQRVDISQFEIGVNFAGPSLLDLFANNTAAEAIGNQLPYDQAVPHNVYRCAPAEVTRLQDERWIAIACMTDAQWQALRQLMGQPAWAAAPALDDVAGRKAAQALIDEHIGAWTAGWDDYELMAACQQAGVPAGVVANGVDLAERDPQLARARFLRPIEALHPDIGQTYADALPIHFDATPCADYQRVRQLGEDNHAVLGEWLQLDEAAIAALAAQDILK